MPGVYRQGDINSVLQQAFQRIRALETQQQMILSNLQGLSVMAFGLIPGSNPQRFGLEAVNPNTGGPLCFIGYDSGTDAAVLQFSNASGQVTSQIDAEGTHYYDSSGVEHTRVDVTGTHYYGADGHELVQVDDTGLHVLDDSGTDQADMGLLNSSPAIYGLQVRNAATGIMQRIAGLVAAGPGALNTSSASPIAVSSTTATAEIGPSGQALVIVCGSAEMNPGTPGSGGFAYMGVGIDGVAPAVQWVNDQIDGYYQLTLSLAASQLVTGLSVGSHTFQAYGWVNNGGGTGNFAYVYVIVIPQ